MNDGRYRAGTSVAATASKSPQGNYEADPTMRDATATGSGSGQQSLAFGTGSGAFDTLISQPRTLAAGASETIDLFAGSTLLDLFGDSGALRTVKGLTIYIVDGGDSSGVRIGGAASQAWPGFFADSSDKITIYPGGPPLPLGKPEGVAVGSTTNNLKIENLGAVGVTYRIMIAGSKAVSGCPMGMKGIWLYP